MTFNHSQKEPEDTDQECSQVNALVHVSHRKGLVQRRSGLAGYIHRWRGTCEAAEMRVDHMGCARLFQSRAVLTIRGSVQVPPVSHPGVHSRSLQRKYQLHWSFLIASHKRSPQYPEQQAESSR